MQPKREPYKLSKSEEDVSYDSNVNPFDEKIEQDQQQQPEVKKKKLKKKKSKKQKKANKKKKKASKESDYDNEEQEEDQINSMFQDEAESGDEDEEDDEEAEVGYEEEKKRFEQLYKRPNATQKLMERFQGKNERQINAQYSKKAIAIRQSEELVPGDRDPKIFVVYVKPRSQDLLVIKILNKAKHLANQPDQVKIVSAISLRKKYPGRIFVEAFTDRDVFEGLQGFYEVFFGKKILPLQYELYEALLAKPIKNKIEFKENNFVRVKKGLYEGDLAKVFKVKKNNIDVLLVPRINVTQIKRKILKQTEKNEDEKAKQQKKQELLRMFTNHKQKNYKQRPSKRQLYEDDFSEIKQFPGIKSIRMGSTNGLIILNYAPDELEKVYGTYLPVEIMPFTSNEGKFVEELKEDFENLATAVNFKKGEEVQIIGGELEKHYGTLVQIKGNVGVIRCKNSNLKGQILQQPLEHISKKFRQGQRVKVISGADSGKTGLIIVVQTKAVEIWTQNSNTIKVSKKNLQVCNGQTICSQNVHQLKKDDLIKTNKNIVGVVLETTKDNIKIMTTENTVQIISNMDFDEKITIRHLVSKNIFGQEIKQGAIVFLRNGQFKGKRCRVVHVYRQYIFMFNENFSRSSGIIVDIADNCSLLSKNDTGRPQLFMDTKQQKQGQYEQGGERIQVGSTITLRTGPLKGYRGVVKSIKKDRIQVRVLSKACTQWVPRSSLTAKAQQNAEIGKTPSRLYGSVKGMNDESIREQPHNQSPAGYTYD